MLKLCNPENKDNMWFQPWVIKPNEENYLFPDLNNILMLSCPFQFVSLETVKSSIEHTLAIIQLVAVLLLGVIRPQKSGVTVLLSVSTALKYGLFQNCLAI